MNYDPKILAKVLATRLVRILPPLINIDQIGFMPGKSTEINIRRVLTHLQIPSAHSQTRVLVALDNKKAFDTVIWSYMLSVLQVFGFGPNFCKWVNLLYKS